jgi:transcriptional regulator with XRE-family HTH domain
MLGKQIGQRLRELRQSRRLSQDEVGFRAGISGKYVGRLERGEINVTIDTLDRLAKALDTTVSDLARPIAASLADDKRVVKRLVRKIVDAGDARQVAKLRALIEALLS